MSDAPRVLAVDLGATSVRVASVLLGGHDPEIVVLHRWQHAPVEIDGSLRWDWPRIVAEVESGLERGMSTGPVASIGVDGWGVDYGLLDAQGSLLGLPYSYRDPRTENWQAAAGAIGHERLYATTGVQLLAINTIFQLAAHDRRELDRATRLLLLPDLLVRHLAGFEGAERSNASTTGLLDARSGGWAHGLIEAVSVDPAIFPDVVGAGRLAGRWRGIPVHLVGSHDTASAFIGMPGPASGTIFVASGTWVIVGVERPEVDTSPAARLANFSNEAGALGGFRFLKNVVGFWIVEQCRAAWGNVPLEQLFDEAAAVDGPVPTFDTNAAPFRAPTDMESEVRRAAELPLYASRGLVVRSVLESIASGTAQAIDSLAQLTGAPVARVVVVGGGTRVPLLLELLRAHTGLRIVPGSPEATALGNAMVQGIALGFFHGIENARLWLAGAGRWA